MSTDDAGGAAAARGDASEAPDEAWEAAPQAEPTPGARRRVEPDLLWIESVTERLLGTAGRPASWERAYFPPEPTPAAEPSAPATGDPQPAHRPSPAQQVHAQPDTPPVDFLPADESPATQPDVPSTPSITSTPSTSAGYTARGYVQAATVVPTTGDPLAAPRPPAAPRHVPPPLPAPARPTHDATVSAGPLPDRPGAQLEADQDHSSYFAPEAGLATPPAAASLAPSEPDVPAAGHPAPTAITAITAITEPTATADTAATGGAAGAAATEIVAPETPAEPPSSRRREEDMPPSVLRAALRDALPDDLSRRPRPVDAIFGDPSWSQPPEPDLSDGEDGEDSAPLTQAGVRLIDLDAPELAARTSPPLAPVPAAAPQPEPIMAAVPSSAPAPDAGYVTAPSAAPTRPAADDAGAAEPVRTRTSPRHAGAPAPASYPRSPEGLATTDVALRLALLSGDEELAASVLELIRGADKDRLRLRLVEAYLDALLDGGGDALAGAARLRRLLGD